MDGAKHVHLQIVGTEQVRPHEIADPARLKRIHARLRADGLLRDPLLVGTVRDIEGFVLLDGTNRKAALHALGLPRAMVQVIDYANHHVVELRTWCHAARAPMEELLQGAATIPGVTLSPLPPLAAEDALVSARTLAVLLDRTRRYVLERSPELSISRTEQLRQLVDLYEDRMVRVECDPDELEQRAQTSTVEGGNLLVAFPRFSRSQVVAIAMEGALIPAGITRHVIQCGRALRVNVTLELLDGCGSLREANASLQAHLSTLQPRMYGEPTILYDS